MGRSDAALPPPRRGSGSAAGWIAAGVLALALGVLVAFQAGKRSHVDREVPAVAATAAPRAEASLAQPPATAPTEIERQVPAPSAAAPQEGRVESAVMEVTIPRPSPAIVAAAINPMPESRETLHEEMTRCLVFDAAPDTDSWHPFLLQLKVHVENRCDVSFAGQEVWFEVRAVLPKTRGAAARETGRFQEPIPARGLAETHIAMHSLDPDGFSQEGLYRFETRLWWASGGGRNAGE